MADDIPVGRNGLASLLRVILGVIVGVTFIVLFMRNVDFAEVGSLFSRAKLVPLAFAVVVFGADFVLRAIRFWAMLLVTTGRHLALVPTIGPFIASFGMSDVLPLRVGDGFRVLWFSRQFRISAGTVIGTMIVERVLDLVTIVILGGIALALLDVVSSPVPLWNFQLVLLIALVGGLGVLLAPAILCRLLEKLFGQFKFAPVTALIGILRATSAAVLRIGSWRQLVIFIAISLALWVLESLVMLGVWVSLGGALDSVLQPFLAFAFSTLGTLVPSLPGHFGSFEYFGFQAFALTGVDASFAAAVLILTHLILWAPTAIFGIIWLLLWPRPSQTPQT